MILAGGFLEIGKWWFLGFERFNFYDLGFLDGFFLNCLGYVATFPGILWPNYVYFVVFYRM